MANVVRSLRRVTDATNETCIKVESAAGKLPWYLWFVIYASLLGAAGIVLSTVEPWFISFVLLTVSGTLSSLSIKLRMASLHVCEE